MNPNEDIKKWDKVLRGAKAEGLQPASRSRENESAPFGFSTRVVAQWIDSRRDAALALWRRWSWSAAACAMVLAVGSVFMVPSHPDEDMLIPTPELEIPELLTT